MASILDAWQSTGSSTLNFGSISSGTNRILVVCLGFEATSGNPSVTGVSMGGQSAVHAYDGSNYAFYTQGGTGYVSPTDIWYFTDSQIDAATDSIITPSYSASPSESYIHAAVYEGLDQAGTTATTPEVNGATTASSTPNPITASITGKADGDLVVAIAADGNSTTCTWGGDFSEVTDINGSSASSSSAVHLSTGSGSITASATIASPNRATLSVVRFAVGAGDAEVSPTVVTGADSIPAPTGVYSNTGYVISGGSTGIDGNWSTLANAEGSSTSDYASGTV